jgi:heat shock protein HslJ
MSSIRRRGSPDRSSGGNTFGADYSITMDYDISVINIVSTEIACTEAGVMERERQILDALESAGPVRI